MTNQPTNNGAHSRGNAESSRHAASGQPAVNDSLIEPSADLPQQEVIRVRKKRKRKMTTKKKVVLAIVIAIVAIALTSGIVFAVSVQQAASRATDYNNADIQGPDSSVKYSQGKTVEYNGHTYQLNENIVSIMFMGVDKTNLDDNQNTPGQADAIMVLALDTSTGKTNIIAVPRDSMVDVNTSGTSGAYAGVANMQICLAYNYGTDDASCAQNVLNSVQRTLYNMPIKYYFALDEAGIGPMCDAIDGVSLTAIDTIPGTNIQAGENAILFGDNALKYVQYRDTSVLDSPLVRLERQKQFVQAFAQQALAQSEGNVGNLMDLYNTIVEYSNTNLGTSDFAYLAGVVANNGISDVQINSLQGTMVQGAKYGEYYLDTDSVYQTVLNVYYTQVS